MASKIDRKVAEAVSKLLQQHSTATEFHSWCTAAENATHSVFESAHLWTDEYKDTDLDLLELCLKATSNSLKLVFTDVTAALHGRPCVLQAVANILWATAVRLGESVVQDAPSKQRLLQIVTDSGVTLHLASAIKTAAGALHALAAVASGSMYPEPVIIAMNYAAALLRTWTHLADTCMSSKLDVACLAPAAEQAIATAGAAPAQLHKLQQAIAAGTDRRQIVAGNIALKDAQDAVVAVAYRAVVICNELEGKQEAAAKLQLPPDELLLLLSIMVGLLTQGFYKAWLAVHQLQQQQQQQQSRGPPAHLQLLNALDADCFTLNNDIYCISPVDHSMTLLPVQYVLQSTLLNRCIAMNSSGSMAWRELAHAIVPGHLQLPLLKALVELVHLQYSFRCNAQIRQSYTARNLFKALKLIMALMNLISASHGSQLREISSPAAAVVKSGHQWSTVPAVVAAGLLKPVMQQVAAVVLSVLNSSSNSSENGGSSNSSGGGCTGSDTSCPTLDSDVGDPSIEDDRRGIVSLFGKMMITLCLSVEPKHLAAALLPDVLTPITLLEVTLRSQATQLDPTDWQQGFLMAASAIGSSSSSSQPVPVPDLQPVALRVAEALSAALLSASFRAAFNDLAATALSDLPSVHQQRHVLLQQLFTLCVTCLKVGQAATEGGAGVQQSAAGAAAIPSAVLSCSSQLLTLVMDSKDRAACALEKPAACDSSSSTTHGQQQTVDPAVVIPVVLLARALYMCMKKLRHKPQQQFTADATEARPALQPPHAAVKSANSAAQQEVDTDEQALVAQLTGIAEVASDGLMVLESFLSSCDVSDGKCASQQEPLERCLDKLLQVDARLHHAEAVTRQQALPAPRVHNRDHLVQLAGDLRASLACVAASRTTDLRQQLTCLPEQLSDFALSVCSSIPLALCCNNPDCQTLLKLSESQLVGGKACVCAGCGVARYCGGQCQRAHWSRHKATCRMLKREKATGGIRI